MRTRKYSIVLLIVAVVIIGLGVLFRPKPKKNQPAPEIDTAVLQRLTQERRLADLRNYLAYAARKSARGLLYIPELQQTGVVLNTREVATALPAPGQPKPPAAPASISLVKFEQQPRRPGVPVLLLRAAPTAPLQPAPASAFNTGDWVMAVALRPDGEPVFAYGLYEASGEAHCGSFGYQRFRAGIPLTAAMLGGGLFSLSGGLGGIIARCGSELVVLATDSVVDAFKRPVSPDDVLQEKYGMRVGAALEGAGVDVVSVWQDGAAALAKLSPGDRIVSVDGNGVRTTPDVFAALDPAVPHALTLRRGRRTLRVEIRQKAPPGEAAVPAIGLVLHDTVDGVAVLTVAGESPAARAGVLPGDLVRRSPAADSTSAAIVAEAIDSSRRPVRLTLARHGAEFEVQLTP